MGFFFLFFFRLSLFFCLSFCLSALCDDRDVSAWTWHSWGHPSALHIKAHSACASMLIRRKWPSTSHMSLHSSDTVCKSFFFLHSACSFFAHPTLLFALLCEQCRLSTFKANLIRSWAGRPLTYGWKQPDLVREEDSRLHSGLNDRHIQCLCEMEGERCVWVSRMR